MRIIRRVDAKSPCDDRGKLEPLSDKSGMCGVEAFGRTASGLDSVGTNVGTNERPFETVSRSTDASNQRQI
jgi:hypothetical protein